jgi:hypothetical protein
MSLPDAKGWHRTSPELLAYYESKLLSHLPLPFRVYQVPLQNNNSEFKYLCNEFINTLEVISDDDAKLTQKPTIVVVHGCNSHIFFHYSQMYS